MQGMHRVPQPPDGAPAPAEPLAERPSSAPPREAMNQLLRAVALRADCEAFAVLFKHFAPRVKSYLMRSNGGEGLAESVAEELTQDTMVMVWRKAAQFDPQQAGLSTWIFAIARNLRVDHLRNRRVPTVESDDEVEAMEVPDQAPALDEQLRLGRRELGVREALRRLSTEQAQVLRLSFYEELPHVGIARELDIPLGTVKSRLRLAVMHLRQILATLEP
jgi:RNA polymerase sigma factor (sigma-70 family)